MKDRIIAWFRTYGEHCLVFSGIVLVGGLCFEAGILQGKMRSEIPVQFSVAAVSPIENQAVKITPDELISNSLLSGESGGLINQKIAEKHSQNCPFVGSKNSTKYHLSTCAVARRIKPENKICFGSQEEAQKRGYAPSCLR